MYGLYIMKIMHLVLSALYSSSRNPKKDLIRIEPSQASYLSRRWLDHILNDYVTTADRLFIHHEPIVHKINQLESYIQEHRQEDDYYIAWMPQSLYGYKDAVFLVVCQNDDGIVYVKNIIPSPHWKPEQIESIELKKTLEIAYKHIDMKYFYESDLRFKLAWSTWWLNV
jgi:hypothetical protein